MKKRQILQTLIMASFFTLISFGGVYAQSDGGDSVCGATTPCNLTTDLAKVTKNGFTDVIKFVTIFVFVALAWSVGWAIKSYLVEGNAAAFKEMRDTFWYRATALIILIALAAGLLTIGLQYLGAKDFPLTLMKLISDAFIPHAYAVDGQLLPNPLGASNLYDFLSLVAKLVVTWFLYPALIVIWVWSGFSYVAAQGNPERIGKSHKILMWAVICTVIVFMLQAFLAALQGTVQMVIPSSQQVANSSVNGVNGSANSVNGVSGANVTTAQALQRLTSLCPAGQTGQGGSSCSPSSILGNALGGLLNSASSTGIGAINSLLGHTNVTPAEQASATSAYQACMSNGGTGDQCAAAYENSLNGTQSGTQTQTADPNVTTDPNTTVDSNTGADNTTNIDSAYQNTNYDTTTVGPAANDTYTAPTEPDPLP